LLRLTKLANKNKRRTLRALYAQTQAYPYAAKLDPNFVRTNGALAGTFAVTGAKAAILPGQVAMKLVGEIVAPATNATTQTNIRPFGLFANFVGGDMDELFDTDMVGIWRGNGSVFEVLAPAFDDAANSGLATPAAGELGTAATELYLQSGIDARLGARGGTHTINTDCARLVSRLSANAIVIELLV
jgi:hypothetical protein